MHRKNKMKENYMSKLVWNDDVIMLLVLFFPIIDNFLAFS